MDLLLNYGPTFIFLDGLKFQSSELSPPWLSAAGAFFFFNFFAFLIFLEAFFGLKKLFF